MNTHFIVSWHGKNPFPIDDWGIATLQWQDSSGKKDSLTILAKNSTEAFKVQEYAFAMSDAAKERERDACCKIVYGQCGSDNVAQRTVDAIRARKNTEMSKETEINRKHYLEIERLYCEAKAATAAVDAAEKAEVSAWSEYEKAVRANSRRKLNRFMAAERHCK